LIKTSQVLNQDLPETITVENLSDAGAETDFYAVKIGDLNYSAETNNLLGADDRSFDDELLFIAENQQFTRGEIVEVNFSSTNFKDIIGFQFSLKFDENSLEFLEVQNGNLTDLEESNFGFNQLEKGILTSSWHSAENAIRLNEKETIFTLKFEALTDGSLANLLTINSVATQAEGYNLAEDLLDVQLEFSGETIAEKDQFELFQNQPNPFAEQTAIEFYLPESGDVQLTIFDLSSKVLLSKTEYFTKGNQKMRVESAEIEANGVLYYRIETEGGTATRKMVKM